MPLKPKSVTTAADELYDLIMREKEISFKDAARRLRVPIGTIEAWATFLEEDGLLGVKYKLTTPYLTLPSLKAKEKQKVSTEKIFQEKLEDAEIKSEIESSSELLSTATHRREEGAFGDLENTYNNLYSKLRKIVDFTVSKDSLSPQRKTKLLDELNVMENKMGVAAQFVKANKFDKASLAYSELHRHAEELMKKSQNYYAEAIETSSFDDAGIKKLIEKTYELMEHGNIEDARENQERIKKMFAGFSKNFLSEKSEIQDGIIKLNKDFAIYVNKVRNRRMHEGNEKIKLLIKESNKSLRKKEFGTATTYYLQIKKIFEELPGGFAKEKRLIKEAVLRVFEQIAKDRERKMRSVFLSIKKQIENLLKETHSHFEKNDVKAAFKTYEKISKLYYDLPHGFIKEKFELQEEIIVVYSILSKRLEANAERELAVKSSEIMQLLAKMEGQIKTGHFDEANDTYLKTSSVFEGLPKGFVQRKTDLQGKIIDVYEDLLQRKDSKKTLAFQTSMEELDKMISEAYEKVKTNEYLKANELYQKIKAAYVRLRPTDVNKRQAIRNKILTLYRRILMLGNERDMSRFEQPMGDVHKKIDALKFNSRAKVRMPA